MPIVYIHTYIHTYIYIAFCRRCHTHGAEDNIWRRRSDTVFSSMGVAGIAKERCFTFIIHQEIDAYVYTIW
jgi:hypothetical protein